MVLSDSFCLATDEDLELIFPLRAAEWKFDLTFEQHIERNRRLRLHPFWTDHARPYVLWKSPGVVGSSLQALNFEFWAKAMASSPVVKLPGVLIESVVTPPEQRGKGYASRLLSGYFGAYPETCGSLTSYVGSGLYSKVGFIESTRGYSEIAVADAPSVQETATPLSLVEFCQDLSEFRRSQVQKSSLAPVAALVPNPLYWDWRWEAYRYRADCAGRAIEEICVRLAHGQSHRLFALPQVTSGALDCLWITEDCLACRNFALSEAARRGLRSVRFWGSAAAGRPQCHMIRFPSSWKAKLGTSVDIQLGDDW
jgi:hypothetical protein